MSINSFLTDTESIYRRSSGTGNEYGEKVDTWTLITTIAGIIHPKSGSLNRVETGIEITYDAVLYCLTTANIRVGDKVKDPSNKYWNVLSIKDAAGKGHHYECFLKGSE